MVKRKKIDIGQIIGAVVFFVLFASLIYFGIVTDDPGYFNGSFFEDVGNVMKVH